MIEIVLKKFRLPRPFKIDGYLAKSGKTYLYGEITRMDWSKSNISYSIRIWVGDKGNRYYESNEIILMSLAHELAHLKHWEHDWKHWRLMAKIIVFWSSYIRKNKVKYEEGRKVV
jgi:hypothetical protein